MKTSRAIVTGGAGFIGSHLVDALIDFGCEVLVVDNFSSGQHENLAAASARGAGRLHIAEMSLNDESLLAEVRSFKPDTVFHLAAQINVRRSVEDPAEDARTNVEGTVRLLEAARIAGAHRIVFSSTGGAIYGEQEYFPADEEHPIHPKAPYGLSKRCGELYLDFYGRDHGMRTVALRLGNVYGPRQNPKGEAGVVSIFATRLLDAKPLRINGDGEQTRDFVYVADVVNAFMKFADADHGAGFSAFNVGWGKEVSVREIVAGMREAAIELGIIDESGSRFSTEHGPGLAGEQQRSVISAAKIQKELSWSAEVSLGEGLVRTLRSFFEQGDRPK
jgi:UDP-glucose 4-epimerase